MCRSCHWFSPIPRYGDSILRIEFREKMSSVQVRAGVRRPSFRAAHQAGAPAADNSEVAVGSIQRTSVMNIAPVLRYTYTASATRSETTDAMSLNKKSLQESHTCRQGT